MSIIYKMPAKKKNADGITNNKTQKHQKCPPEICPTGKCPRNTDWNVKTQKCRIKPYTDWQPVKNGIRYLPADLKDMVGEEVYKKEYEDKAAERGETILLRQAPKNANEKIPPPVPIPVPEPEPEVKGPLIVRKPFKVSISKAPPIIVAVQATQMDAKPSDSESSDAESSDAESSDAESSDSESSDAEPSDSESSDAEPSDTEPSEYQADPEYDFLYPHLDDPNFNLKIAQRKEFNDTQYDGIIDEIKSIQDIQNKADKLCSADFELMPHQSFVKNFMSSQTPYNSLLLYHGLGTGKTCSAIGISEEMRNFMKQIGQKKSIMIIASPNVQDNFMLQLFDERKLKLEDGIWTLNTCVGNALLKEINPTDTKGIESDRENITSQIKSIIRQYYVFMGYTTFANFINESIEIKGEIQYNDDEKKRIKGQRIKNIFNDRLIIIDEVHNIRMTNENASRKPADLLMDVARNTDNMRLLLLSATPMYNSHEEIIWLVNLMNLNDKRKTIKTTDVFEKDGSFKLSGGIDLLRRKLNGYVSYVRGENPYTFPYRIYPENDSSVTYPTTQMNQKPIEANKASKQYIPLYFNGIGEYQAKVYKQCIENLHKRGEDEEKAFEEKESFGYSILQKPLEALNIVYPSDEYIADESQTIEDEHRMLMNMIGKNGLSNVMRYRDANTDKQYNFEYKTDKYGRIFSPTELPKYSAKIAKICETVKKSKGTILIYTQYIDGGAVPVALALEELGFGRYGSDKGAKSLFKTAPVPPIDSITMEPAKEGDVEFNQARYMMITGDVTYSPNNVEDLKYLNSDENAYGKLVKVVIISRAAGEGIDFKNIRQVHILEPWYNMNRIEQIIGRGVRNLSHCKLLFEERNVEIFLHATLLGTTEESADMYVYRLAEQKAITIGRVTRVLKEAAVDCLLNISQTNFSTKKLFDIVKNETLKLTLSSGREIDYKIGDKPYTDICDYMEDCDFKCYPNPDTDINLNIKLDTYNIEFAEGNNTRIMQRIRELFKERHFYNKSELIESINSVKKYPDEQIYSSLTRMIDNSNEYVVDKYGRMGHIVNNGDIYLFQPVEITDKSASIYERMEPVEFKNRNVSIELPKYKRVAPKMDSFEKIIENLTLRFDIAFSADESIDTWYSVFNSIRPHLTDEYEITEAQMKKHVVYHMIDNMMAPDKIIMLNTIYNNSWQPSADSDVERLVYSYFEDRLVTADNGDIGISLTTDNKSTRIYHQSDNDWVEAPYVESSNIIRSKDYAKKYVRKQRLNDVIGFTAWFEEGTRTREYVFKTKYLTAKRNQKGLRMSNALRGYTLPRLNAIVGEPNKYKAINKFNIDTLSKISVLTEVLTREFNDSKKEKVWYLNNEQAIINKV
jgi:hypothetical protein